ncbi:MAG: ankyrin repeat domain-containing protein, partial [Pseudomonadota bacterium]
EIVDRLIDIDPQLVHKRTKTGLSPLCLAMVWDRTAVVNSLLNHGASANEKWKDGLNPLRYACSIKSNVMINLILDKLTPESELDEGESPLYLALSNKKLKSPVEVKSLPWLFSRSRSARTGQKVDSSTLKRLFELTLNMDACQQTLSDVFQNKNQEVLDQLFEVGLSPQTYYHGKNILVAIDENGMSAPGMASAQAQKTPLAQPADIADIEVAPPRYPDMGMDVTVTVEPQVRKRSATAASLDALAQFAMPGSKFDKASEFPVKRSALSATLGTSLAHDDLFGMYGPFAAAQEGDETESEPEAGAEDTAAYATRSVRPVLFGSGTTDWVRGRDEAYETAGNGKSNVSDMDALLFPGSPGFGSRDVDADMDGLSAQNAPVAEGASGDLTPLLWDDRLSGKPSARGGDAASGMTYLFSAIAPAPTSGFLNVASAAHNLFDRPAPVVGWSARGQGVAELDRAASGISSGNAETWFDNNMSFDRDWASLNPI